MAAKALIVLGLGAAASASYHAPALAYHPAGGYGYHKYGEGYSYTDRSPQGLHKRSTYEHAPALAYHPAGGYGYNKYAEGYSYTDRSPQGLHKRSAPVKFTNFYDVEAEDGNQYFVINQIACAKGEHCEGDLDPKVEYEEAQAYHPAGGYGYHKFGPGKSSTFQTRKELKHKREAEPSYAPALAYHPAGGYGYNKYGPGYSYTDRSPQGLHKRSTYEHAPALAYHPAGGYGYHKYGEGYSYTDRSPQGLHKREASGTSYQTVEREDCYGYDCQNSAYDVKTAGYSGEVDEVREGNNFAFNYGFDI